MCPRKSRVALFFKFSREFAFIYSEWILDLSYCHYASDSIFLRRGTSRLSASFSANRAFPLDITTDERMEKLFPRRKSLFGAFGPANKNPRERAKWRVSICRRSLLFSPGFHSPSYSCVFPRMTLERTILHCVINPRRRARRFREAIDLLRRPAPFRSTSIFFAGQRRGNPRKRIR